MPQDFVGHRVMVSPYLPIYPSDAENARRIVRHGLIDVLLWLGVEPGPQPGEPQRIFVAADGTPDGPLTIVVDQQTYDSLKVECA